MLHSMILKSTRNARSSAFEEFRSKMAGIEAEESRIARELMSAAPKEVVPFLEEEGIVNDLLAWGSSSRKIVYADNSYGFKIAGDVRQAFLKLVAAWQGAVQVLFREEEHRIEVFISV